MKKDTSTYFSAQTKLGHEDFTS